MGAVLARPRTPSVPKRERGIRRDSYRICRPDRESLAGAGHVVHAQDGGAMLCRLDRQPDRGRIALPRLLDTGRRPMKPLREEPTSTG